MCYQHIELLAQGMVSTKEVLEDVIGQTKDVASRDQKRQTGRTAERTFFYNTRSGAAVTPVSQVLLFLLLLLPNKAVSS